MIDIADRNVYVILKSGFQKKYLDREIYVRNNFRYLPIPKKLAKKGVKDMIRISDARMSGTAFGTIVLHVTPEGVNKGPLAVVKTGDTIRLSEKNKTIDLMISKIELEKRLKKLKIRNDKVPRGYKKLYGESVLPATEGCDFDFL